MSSTVSKASSLNWGKIFKSVTPSMQARILTIRSTNDDYKRQLFELKAAEPKIDFEKYEAILGEKKYFQELQTIYEKVDRDTKNIKVSLNQVTPIIDQDTEVLNELQEKLNERIQHRLEVCNDKLDAFKEAPPFEEWSVIYAIKYDTAHVLFPELKTALERQYDLDLNDDKIYDADELEIVHAPFSEKDRANTLGNPHDCEEFVHECYEKLRIHREEAKQQADYGGTYFDEVAKVLAKYKWV